ncbi:MAG: hypothetical protein PHP45_03420 [Elusimicrobiales bacterium]|nr:hypothetical protein [Elusimicrobiales bacterium]
MIDLQKFCLQDKTYTKHKTLGQPFVRGGHKYATSGHIVVRIETNEPESPDYIGVPLGGLTSIFVPLASVDSNSLKPWPISDGLTQAQKCRRCSGTGKKDTETCPKCGGDCAIECSECGHDYKCPMCDGHGVISNELGATCPDCRGAKNRIFPANQRVDIALIAGENFSLISKLPRAIYIPPKDAMAPLLFVFDGGEGAVMPMRG